MDMIEFGKTLGRIEANQMHLSKNVESFITTQTEKNKDYDATHEYVSNVRAKGSGFRRLLFWVIGLFFGSGGGHTK